MTQTHGLEGGIRLEALHLQITGACNLRCRMCGQWGEHGYQVGRPTSGGMRTEDWIAVLRQAAPARPRITLWGGEPLLAPDWRQVAGAAVDLGLEVMLVTNGTLLEQQAEAMAGLFSCMYVSVDGPAGIHDRIRGRSGIFAQVEAGIRRLREVSPDQRLCVMTTLVSENRGQLSALAPSVSAWGVTNWLLSPQIFMSPQRAGRYASFQAGRGCARTDGSSWTAEFPAGFGAGWREEVKALVASWPGMPIRLGPADLEVDELAGWFDQPDDPLGATVQTVDSSVRMTPQCWAPFRRLSIRADGSTNACLDISDGSFGNVRSATPLSILQGAQAESFRAAIAGFENPACVRCPWRWNGSDYRRGL